MSVDPTDWQCCVPLHDGLRCTEPLTEMGVSHPGPHRHEHDLRRWVEGGEDRGTYCGCETGFQKGHCGGSDCSFTYTEAGFVHENGRLCTCVCVRCRYSDQKRLDH